MEETKWDALYDPKKRSLFSRIEEFAINAYFSDVFTKAILSAAKIKMGSIFEIWNWDEILRFKRFLKKIK